MDSIASDIGSVEEWNHPDRLSRGELADCRGERREEHVAARVLAKSLVLRSLDDEVADGWDGIECRKTEKGRPFLELTGEVRRAAHRAEWGEIHVSWSHTENTVVAILWATEER